MQLARYTKMGEVHLVADSRNASLEGYGKAKRIREASPELYLPYDCNRYGKNMADPIDSAL